eukprot:3042738-Pleurochrysis_carterae.AAC.3
MSQGKSDRCQRRPACAMPYTGFSTRHTQGRPQKVPPAHPHILRVSDSGERTQGRGAHRGAERLVIVYAGHLSAPLHAQPGFECVTSLTLVNPDQADEGTARVYLRSIAGGPTSVVVVVGYFRPFRGTPAQTILRHRLLARAWIVRNFADRERTSGFAPPRWFGFRGTESEQRRRLPRAQRVVTQGTPERCARSAARTGLLCTVGRRCRRRGRGFGHDMLPRTRRRRCRLRHGDVNSSLQRRLRSAKRKLRIAQ